MINTVRTKRKKSRKKSSEASKNTEEEKLKGITDYISNNM